VPIMAWKATRVKFKFFYHGILLETRLKCELMIDDRGCGPSPSIAANCMDQYRSCQELALDRAFHASQEYIDGVPRIDGLFGLRRRSHIAFQTPFD
jgi:hypothetical protein